MRPALDAVLARFGGVASRATLLTAATRNEFDDEVRRGHLVAVFPRAYCRPWDVDLPRVRDRAALVSVGGNCALSHLSALRRYALPAGEPTPIHVTTSVRRHPLCADAGLAVHRTRLPTPVRRVGGLPVVPPAVAVVTSWPLLPPDHQRAPAIAAARNGLVTGNDLRAALMARIGLPGRRAQLELAALVAAGCESELELWGHTGVFTIPGLDHGRPQHLLTTPAGRFRLDLGYADERVAVEMDGWQYHSTREQRERDLRRDTALAAFGWITLRFSHHRLHQDVAGCRRDTLAVLASRRVRGD